MALQAAHVSASAKGRGGVGWMVRCAEIGEPPGYVERESARARELFIEEGKRAPVRNVETG